MYMLPEPDLLFDSLTAFWKDSGLTHEEAQLLAYYQIATGDLYDHGPTYSEDSKRAWA